MNWSYWCRPSSHHQLPLHRPKHRLTRIGDTKNNSYSDKRIHCCANGIELQEPLARQRSAQLQRTTTQEDSELGMLHSTMPLSQSPPTMVQAQHHVEMLGDMPQPPLAQDPHGGIISYNHRGYRTTMNSSLPPRRKEENTIPCTVQPTSRDVHTCTWY